MYRVRRNGNLWRTRWPFRIWWPPRIDERFCPKCTLPFVNGPEPEQVRQFLSGNVAAILYPSGDWKRERFVIRLGRWKPGSGRFYLSEFVPDEELDDLDEVIVQVREYFAARAQARQGRRRFASQEKLCSEGAPSSPRAISRTRSH